MTRTAARAHRSRRLAAGDACPRCRHTEELANFRLVSLIREAVDLKERLDALEARLWGLRSPELRLVPDTAWDAARSLHGPIETPQSTNAMTDDIRCSARGAFPTRRHGLTNT